MVGGVALGSTAGVFLFVAGLGFLVVFWLREIHAARDTRGRDMGDSGDAYPYVAPGGTDRGDDGGGWGDGGGNGGGGNGG